MIYITGDTHRYFDRVEDICSTVDSTTDDVIIILGDAGINYYGDYAGASDWELKRELSELPITLFCIHGNHEMRPESIDTYETIEWNGGLVYSEEEFPNLLFAKDGEIYDINGRRAVVIGGANSIDKFMRIRGQDWWPDEQPSDEIKNYVENQLEKIGWEVDIVLSHTCPYKYLPRHVFLPFVDEEAVDNSTEEWLDLIEDKLKYDIWFCGHFHTDESFGRICFMWNDVTYL